MCRPVMRGTSLIVGAALLFVGCDNVQYIQVDPQNVSLRTKNDNVWLHAVGKSQTGRDYPKAEMSWSVKDPSIAQVDQTGRVTPVKSGATELVVKHGDVKASIPVEVLFAEKLTVEPTQLTLKVGDDGQDLKVRVFDYRGKELKDRSATFQVKDGKVANMGGNKVFPGDPGKTQVIVRAEDATATVDVTVEGEKSAKK